MCERCGMVFRAHSGSTAPSSESSVAYFEHSDAMQPTFAELALSPLFLPGFSVVLTLRTEPRNGCSKYCTRTRTRRLSLQLNVTLSTIIISLPIPSPFQNHLIRAKFRPKHFRHYQHLVATTNAITPNSHGTGSTTALTTQLVSIPSGSPTVLPTSKDSAIRSPIALNNLGRRKSSCPRRINA